MHLNPDFNIMPLAEKMVCKTTVPLFRKSKPLVIEECYGKGLSLHIPPLKSVVLDFTNQQFSLEPSNLIVGKIANKNKKREILVLVGNIYF